MIITDELRAYADGVKSDPDAWMGPGDEFKAIADRIDAAHKQAVDKAHADGERNGLQQARSASEDYRRGYEAGKRQAWSDGFDEGFASADDWLAEHEDAMAEHGWVKLPVDADGVPFRVGDEVQEVDSDVKGSVYQLCMEDGNWWVYANGVGRRPDKYRHYHAPTVEDVLNEMLDVYCSNDSRTPCQLVAEYAAKLQLKENA